MKMIKYDAKTFRVLGGYPVPSKILKDNNTKLEIIGEIRMTDANYKGISSIISKYNINEIYLENN
jgi:hypothetical protein